MESNSEFTCRFKSRATSHQTYSEIQVVEWDAHGEYVATHTIWAGRGSHIMCDCDGQQGDSTRFRRCVHAAVYKTWARQGFPYNVEDMIPRFYTVEDNRLAYWKAGKWHQLSTLDQVNRGPLEVGAAPARRTYGRV
jgi:hypothetical protein